MVGEASFEVDADVLEPGVAPEQAAADGADPLLRSEYMTMRSIQFGVVTSMSSLSSSSCSPSLRTAPRLILAEKSKGPLNATSRSRSPAISRSSSRMAGSVPSSTTQTIS